MSVPASRGQSGRPTSEYADVPEMFRDLAELTEGAAPFQRRRDRIVERCLVFAVPAIIGARTDGARAAVLREHDPDPDRRAGRVSQMHVSRLLARALARLRDQLE